MSNSINLIAFGTFGNPNGFKQTFFVGNKELAKTVKTFDLNTNAIKLFVNSKVYSIRKEFANGFNTIAYSIYTYAKEQNSDRSGTFIGSSILYTNKIAKEHITIAQLNEFHNQLVSKNVSSDTISVNHSDKFSVIKPKDFDKIEYDLREIENLNFRQNTDNFLVVFCNISDNNLNLFFEHSIALLNVYDTIYFTDSQEVAEFVHQKGVFKLIQNVGDKRDFDREINNYIDERKPKREQSIIEFEREAQKINDDKNRTIQEFKNQIEQSERTHFENEKKLKEAKEDFRKMNQFYDDFINKTKHLISQLRLNNGKLEEVKQIHNSNKTLFNNKISGLKRPNFTTTIAKPKGILPTVHQRQDFEYSSGYIRREEREELEEEDFKIDKYKVATLVLAILLIITWVYFLFFKSNLETEVNQEQVNTVQQPQKPVEITKTEDLNPISNSTLSENDYRIVAKNLIPNMKLEEVVKVIFNKNPTEISSFYAGQETIYSKNLLELNKKCFVEKEGIYYFAKDTIRQIPSYKKK
ncbi:MAG: hypothetical protein CFE22_03860 [Cytophagaceae bacterium BCCC1]|nr:MAG: hypothetical protein CFE22_03860 [Cytophagaceae bacterium BCCC1]